MTVKLSGVLSVKQDRTRSAWRSQYNLPSSANAGDGSPANGVVEQPSLAAGRST